MPKTQEKNFICNIFSKKSQMSPEYIYFIAIVIVITLIYISLTTDYISVIAGESENSLYWRNMQVGILKIDDNGDNTSIYLLNNHRENITINDVKLNNVSLSISGEIEPGKAREFVSLQTGFQSEAEVWMNYSLRDEVITFNGDSITFEGIQN